MDIYLFGFMLPLFEHKMAYGWIGRLSSCFSFLLRISKELRFFFQLIEHGQNGRLKERKVSASHHGVSKYQIVSSDTLVWTQQQEG